MSARKWKPGLCRCGCGGATAIAKKTFTAKGYVKGQPRPYIKGHNARVPLEEKFWRHVRKTETCWLWTGAKTYGYGSLGHRGNSMAAHRLAYELFVGPIPDGLHIDHLCRVRACVNPAHLEAVTQQENNRRMHAVRTQCLHGHELDGVTRSGHRYCKACKRAKNARRREARRQKVAAA